MKTLILIMVLGFSVSACAQHRPISSPCFSSTGAVKCKFTPLAELHAQGDANAL